MWIASRDIGLEETMQDGLGVWRLIVIQIADAS